MASVNPERMSAQIEGDFVVFLIGMRVNKPWQIHKWLPVSLAMKRMLDELRLAPELGLLGVTGSPKVLVQYWRSFEHLEAYAKSRDSQHLPAWRAFNQAFAKNRGDIGIWHETYMVRAGEYETLYSGMPPFGLGAATTLTTNAGANKNSARQRMAGNKQ